MANEGGVFMAGRAVACLVCLSPHMFKAVRDEGYVVYNGHRGVVRALAEGNFLIIGGLAQSCFTFRL